MGYYRAGDFLGISNWDPFNAPTGSGMSLNQRADAISRSISGADTMPGGAIPDDRDAGWAARGRELVGHRYRRTNVGNIRALRRAMRRVQGFAKLAHRTISFTHRVKMKKHRRK